MTPGERETVERFEAHVAFTDSVLKEALREDLAGRHELAYDIVWDLRETVLALARERSS